MSDELLYNLVLFCCGRSSPPGCQSEDCIPSIHTPLQMAQASICFLARDELYETTRPYAIQYEPHGDVPQTNVKQEMVNNIPIRNLRPFKDTLKLEKDGIVVRDLNTQMTYEKFADPVAVQDTYLPKVRELLRDVLETQNVAILEYLVSKRSLICERRFTDCQVRRRNASFPFSPGTEYEFAQPVPNAHVGKSRSTLLCNGLLLIEFIQTSLRKGSVT